MLSPARTWPGVKSAMQLFFSRSLTSSEASAALRPFIFSVHPDLFANFPEARIVNENSLKQLNGYLHELPQSRLRNPLPLTFYVRPDPSINKQGGSNLKTVTIQLSNDAYGTVKHILESCHLDTSHLPKSAGQFSHPWKRLYDNYQNQGTSEPKAQWDITFEEAVQRRAMKKKKKRDPPLEQRVTKLLEEAAAALRTHESALNSLKFAIAELKKKYGFAGISWDDNDNWSLAILRGHIGLLKRTLELYEFPAAAVRSLTIKFVPRGSYMAVNGDAILGADEVPEQWIRTLELVTNSAAVANFIPKMERELSQLLRGLQVKVDLAASAFTYRRQLYQLLERLRTAEAKLRSELPQLSHLWANVVEGTMSLNVTVEIQK